MPITWGRLISELRLLLVEAAHAATIEVPLSCSRLST